MSYYPDPADAAKSFSSRVEELESAIREHRDQTGDDRCWQDDSELYSVLPEGYTPPVIDEPVMLENCKRYIERRQCPLTTYVPNLVEQAVHDLIARKAVHAKKGTVMGEEKWIDIFDHLKEEASELKQAITDEHAYAAILFFVEPTNYKEKIDEYRTHILEELGDIYGVLVHAIVKAGFTVRQVEDRELLKLKERFPEDASNNAAVL